MNEQKIKDCIKMLEEALQETWVDPETDLEWQVVSPEQSMTWHEANNYAKSLGDDWRLPTRKELYSLVSDTKTDPCIKTSDLKCDSPSYWTSPPHAASVPSAWGVYFGNGYVFYSSKTNTYYVRCVRDAKNQKTPSD